ncbi:MAG: hypothetical protein IPN47_27940 [Gemmatimonadetes bacterium]|nr:hypothetical protein [Gemmatimonadota bacterium]
MNRYATVRLVHGPPLAAAEVTRRSVALSLVVALLTPSVPGKSWSGTTVCIP